jgi:hypothetical protein
MYVRPVVPPRTRRLSRRTFSSRGWSSGPTLVGRARRAADPWTFALSAARAFPQQLTQTRVTPERHRRVTARVTAVDASASQA